MPKKPQDRKPTAIGKIALEAGELDLRRQAQISNQKDSINRLLVDGSYSVEMQHLHEALADAQVLLAKANDRIQELEKDG